jgi:hypothetical protein
MGQAISFSDRSSSEPGPARSLQSRDVSRDRNLPGNSPRKRANSEDNWDFFVTVDDHGDGSQSFVDENLSQCVHLSLPPPQTHPPLYILEAPLEDQELWYRTAGTRPMQPPDERRYFEEQWERNFKQSRASKSKTASSDEQLGDKHVKVRRERGEEVLFRGKGPFSCAVSKSFAHYSPHSVTMQVCLCIGLLVIAL